MASSRVVVITGASSGIGRATALAFARGGASLVLAARRGEALADAASACAAAGGRAVAVEADVTEPAAMAGLAARAVEEYGRIDVWVNDAGVLAMGRFEELPGEIFRQVVEVNFFGAVHGARAALRRFRDQGRGVLINVGSLESVLAAPFSSAYSASKHALLGWTRSLQQELAMEGDGIHVCAVLPATMDTPLFQSAANFTDHPVQAMPPVYSATRVARRIVELADRPRAEVFVGPSAHAFGWLARLAPTLTHRVFAELVRRWHLDRQRAAGRTPGNAFQALHKRGRVSGGWRDGRSRAPGALLAGIPLAVFGLRWLVRRAAARG